MITRAENEQSHDEKKAKEFEATFFRVVPGIQTI